MAENIAAANDDTALERLLSDLEANKDGQRRIVRRVHTTPISPDPLDEPTFLTEIPTESHGPFIDKQGRVVHIDVIAAATLIGVQFAGQNAPFMYFSIDNPPTGSTSSLPVSIDGSVWIIASKLLTSAPSGFVGLRVGKGTISFSAAVPVNVNPIVIPTSVGVTATLTLHPESVKPPGVPGSTINTPLNVKFSFNPTTGRLLSADDGYLEVFRYKVNLKLKIGQAEMHDLISQLTFPFTPDKQVFAVVDSSSQIAKFSGTAPISSGAWALQIANVPPAQLGQASGAGGMLLNLSEGLQVLPLDRGVPIDCGKCTIFVQPNSVSIFGASAVAQKLHTIELWTQSSLSFRMPIPSTFRYISTSVPSEVWAITGNLVVMLSQPRTIDNTGFRVSGKGSLLLLKTGSNEVQIQAAISLVRNQTRTTFALKNALFNLVGPSSFTVSGTFKKGSLVDGKIFLPFTLGFAIPFLPDPYTYSDTIDPPTAPTSTPVMMTLSWPATPPDHLVPVIIDIDLNTTQPNSLFPSGETEKTPDTATSILKPAGPTLLDLSTNLSQFGVTYLRRESPNQGLSVKDLYLQTAASAIHVVTLPAVQWEPLFTAGPDPNAPSRLGFLNSGPMTQFTNNTVTLTPLAPRQAIDGLLTAFHSSSNPQVNVHFTLPFGLEAYGNLNQSNNPSLPTTNLNQVQPRFTSQNWMGGDQLSITVELPSKSIPGLQRSPVIPGRMQTVDVGTPAGKTALEPIKPDNTFATGPRAGVPVSRVDISGFGESTFSDWHDPSNLPATISKVEFGVIVGRTFREIVQEFSVLLPYGVFVVRSIIIERQNTGVVTRTDTGWRAVADGDYKVLLKAVVTHPGVVLGATKVKNIRDTDQIFNGPGGSQFEAVVFDCFITMENVVIGHGPEGVPAVDQVGYVVTAPANQALQPDAYAALLAAKGSLGGRIDCTINVGNSGLLFRVTHVGVGVTGTTTAPEFVMAAWGTPVLPGGGQWSVAQMVNATLIPKPVDQDTSVPLIRNSPVNSQGPFSTPYRFAAPVDLISTATPTIDYGIIYSTGTQRVLFLRPKIEVSSFALSSVLIPFLADPAVLATSTGIFPRLDFCIPFNDNLYRLLIRAGNNLTLSPSASFATKAVARVIRDSQTLRSIAYTNDIAGNPSIVDLSIDTTAAVPWSLKITNLSSAFESGSLGEVMRVVSTLTADAKSPAKLVDAQVVWGSSMDPVVKALTFFNGFGPVSPLVVSMTNQWSYQFSMQIDLAGFKKQFPIVADILGQFIKTFSLGITSVSNPTATSIQMNYDVVIMIPIGTGSVVGFGKVRVLMKTAPTTGKADPATSLVELEVGAGWGLDFKIAGFGAYAFAVLALVIIAGANTFGIGAAIILRGSIDLKVLTIQLTSELKGVQVWESCNQKKDKSTWLVAQATISIDIVIFLVVDIGFSVQYQWVKFQDNDHCPLSQLPI